MLAPAFGLNRFDFRSVAAFAADVRRAEELGWDYGFIPDSQLRRRDTYVMLAEAARATSRIRIGPLIANPINRHISVTASSIATVDELAEGRTLLGLGIGDTAVRLAGLRPARVRELEEATRLARALLDGEAIEVGARAPARLPHARPVPVWIAAGGPRMLRAAGRVADGVFIRVGTSPANLEAAIEAVRAGAARGRARPRRRLPGRRLPHRARRRRGARAAHRAIDGRRVLRVLADAVRGARPALGRTARRGAAAQRQPGLPPHPGPRGRGPPARLPPAGRRRGLLPPRRRRGGRDTAHRAAARAARSSRSSCCTRCPTPRTRRPARRRTTWASSHARCCRASAPPSTGRAVSRRRPPRAARRSPRRCSRQGRPAPRRCCRRAWAPDP